MADFQDGEAGTVKVKNGPGGFLKNLFGEDTGTGVEIMDHVGLFEWQK